MKKYYVYILKSLKDDGLYIGQTININRRINEHKNGKVQSTKARRPLKLLSYKILDSRKEAVNYEKNLKKGCNREKLKNIFL